MLQRKGLRSSLEQSLTHLRKVYIHVIGLTNEGICMALRTSLIM